MKLISVGAGLAAAGLLVTSAALAAPAQAFPSNAWWYSQLGVAKAQQVTKGAGVTVAVIDTGVKASLGDLRGQVLPGKSFTGGDPRTDLPDPRDKYSGHGTAMASYIAGTGKGAGMVGIAPAAKILPVRDSRDGRTGVPDYTADGIVWAAQHGAKVINVSSAGQSACPASMQRAVDYAVRRDAIVVAGTGNTPGIDIGFPANCIGAIAVGGLAYSSSFRAWSDSTTGPQLDFVAPADHMKQLLLDDTISNPDGSGTSNATALVSGTFALLRAKYPKESARQIVTRALYNVHNGLGGKIFAKRIDNQLGYGEILPSFALTENPPAGAKNPIYDEIDAHLKGASSTGSSAAPSSSSAGPSSAAPSSDSAGGGSPDSSGVSPAAVIGIVAGVIVVVVLVAVVIARSRRPRRTGGYGPPPGAYGS